MSRVWQEQPRALKVVRRRARFEELRSTCQDAASGFGMDHTASSDHTCSSGRTWEVRIPGKGRSGIQKTWEPGNGAREFQET